MVYHCTQLARSRFSSHIQVRELLTSNKYIFIDNIRVSRQTFDRLVSLLEPNPIFKSKGKKPQRPVRFQLASFLIRYGARGADAHRTAKEMGLGSGTVYLYCYRVIHALRELGLQVLTWGDDERKELVATYIMDHYGFPNCVGMLDGTLIRLTEMPHVMGPTYLCRKKFPAINIQATVDHTRRFTSFDMGWPGSVADVYTPAIHRP
ncbi:hypothetical protein OG21DRAFT_1423426 [Imleria badia]|nr:hypothetical protein OG21DRAFT_1423426 [Imleria badia]